MRQPNVLEENNSATVALLNNAMDNLFRFRVGDVCQHVSAPPLPASQVGMKVLGPADKTATWNYQMHSITRPEPVLFVVIEQLVQRCAGGIQLQYVCRLCASQGADCKTVTVQEYELKAYEPEAKPSDDT